jgi:hypothetical protein
MRITDRSEFDVRQGRDQPVALYSVDRRDPEAAVILEQLLLGIMVVAVTLLLLPFLLVMAGVGAAMLLWFVVSAAVLGALIFLGGVSRYLRACDTASCAGDRFASCRHTNPARGSLRDARPPTCRLRAPRDGTDAMH